MRKLIQILDPVVILLILELELFRFIFDYLDSD